MRWSVALILDWRFWTVSALGLGTPLAAFLVLLAVPAWDREWGTNAFHFWAVSGTALGAAVFCAFLIGGSRSLRESRALFLGLAFLSIAAIFAVHGMGTPGHIHAQPHAELRVSSWLSVFVGAFFVACSAVTLPEKAEHWFERYGSAVFAVIALGLGAYIGFSMATPGWMGFIPAEDRTLQLAVSSATFTMLGFAAWRYFQAFLFARLPSQWAMVLALVLLIEVQAALTWGRFDHYSWWEYHFLYGGAFLVLYCGWFLEARRAGSLSVFAESLAMRDAVAQLNRGYAQPIADLVDAIELKDLYTLGHVRRVAAYALIIGREFRLPAADLHDLALAAQMHDVGKIGTPDRILTKPGPLTAEEFAVIREHVEKGHEIARKVPALRAVSSAIRHHHEKFDGSGYPDGLSGDDIPLLARIVSVADAYDAMTSGRVYQAAQLHQDAIEELRRCSGNHFDPACVQAFISGLTRASSAGDIELPGAALRPREVAA